MKTDIWFPIYIGDWQRATSQLHARECGAYLQLLMALWEHGGTLNFDERKLARAARLDGVEEFRDVWVDLEEFFTIENGLLSQDRLTEELDKARARRERSVMNGMKGGRPKKTKPRPNLAKTQQVISSEPRSKPDANLKKTSSSSSSSSSSKRREEEENTMSGKPDVARKSETVLLVENVIQRLNDTAGKCFSSSSTSTTRQVSARLREGFTEQNFFAVIERKSKQWSGTDMDKFLRPETLFGNKFESYLNEIDTITRPSVNGESNKARLNRLFAQTNGGNFPVES